MKIFLSTVGLFLLVGLVGCASKDIPKLEKAPKLSSGKSVELYYLFDTSITENMDEKHQAELNRLVDYMKNHFDVSSEKIGYIPKVIDNKSSFKAGSGKYLLPIKITKFNPGNVVARFIFGHGAGVASMDIHYELYKDQSTLLLKEDDHEYTTNPVWTVIPGALNIRMLKKVNQAITQNI